MYGEKANSMKDSKGSLTRVPKDPTYPKGRGSCETPRTVGEPGGIVRESETAPSSCAKKGVGWFTRLLRSTKTIRVISVSS